MIVVAHLLWGIIDPREIFENMRQLVHFGLYLDEILYTSLLLYLNNNITIARFAWRLWACSLKKV